MTRNHSVDSGRALYKVKATASLGAIVMRNSLFAGNLSSHSHVDRFALYYLNCSFGAKSLEELANEEVLQELTARIPEAFREAYLRPLEHSLA